MDRNPGFAGRLEEIEELVAGSAAMLPDGAPRLIAVLWRTRLQQRCRVCGTFFRVLPGVLAPKQPASGKHRNQHTHGQTRAAKVEQAP
jgi:hypothetical protein